MSLKMNDAEYVLFAKDKHNSNEFTRKELEAVFDYCQGKTFEFLDRMNVFAKAFNNPKITGIAGDVVEQSILGMKQNSRQEPDLIVDGKQIELKTTGLRVDKKNKGEFTPKEPVTITAVSINKIVDEDYFDKSTLWHKLQSILFVYYHYNSPVTVNALGYSKFTVLSHQFYMPSDLDRARFENDWRIVRDFLRKVQNTYDEPEKGYPLLSTEINPQLVVLDTAPKYPHPPRFRIKRAYFAVIVKKHFAQKLESLSDEYVSYEQLDIKLHSLKEMYAAQSVRAIAYELGLDTKRITKQMAEQLIVRMFGGNSKKMSKVEMFEAFGITGYSIALSAKDGRTEDTKMCPINFSEVMEEKDFEDSDFYHYYHDNTFLFFIVKETEVASSAKGKEVKVDYGNNQFLGFKRVRFSEEFIYKNVKPVWEKIRELISEDKLEFVPDLKKDGTPIINPTGEIKGAPNFPKSSEGIIFVRGTGSNSSDKKECVNGIRMYRQNLWIRGDEIVEILSQQKFI
ncbi:MAG: restriction endonuclease [Lachnospiraceae bacterium]|nr:restriction endonuclease [Lachnospiraceae bacterium]